MARPRPPGEPLDRWLSRSTRLSIRELRRHVQWGQVQVDGLTCHQYRESITPSHTVTLNGNICQPGQDDTILVMWKPLGFACSHDVSEGPLIYDLVPPQLNHPDLQTCGRLDRATSGFIILTYDGRLTPVLMEPSAGASKRYRVGLLRPLPEHAIEEAASGSMYMAGDPVPLLPVHIEKISDLEILMTLREGRHHQIRRMIRGWNSRVRTLHREEIHGLAMPPDLTPGQVRPMRPDERQHLLGPDQAQQFSPWGGLTQPSE